MHKNSAKVQCSTETDCQSPDMLQTKTAYLMISIIAHCPHLVHDCLHRNELWSMECTHVPCSQHDTITEVYCLQLLI